LSLGSFITFGAFVLLFIFFSVTANNFFTVRNVLTLALQTATITMMGIGVTFVIITGGIDLSIGSVVALTGTSAVLIANAGVPSWIAMIIGVLVGVVCGYGNGLLITKFRLPPFIATLGSMMIVRGIVLTITNANSASAPDDFGNLANNALFKLVQKNDDGTLNTIFPGVSWIVLIMILLALIFAFVLKMTKVGRYAYAIGSNEEATRLSGIKVNRYKVFTYIICGFLAGVVGVLLASRMVTSQPNGGIGYELNAIAASVIGGTSLMGGMGTVGGAVIGSFIIGVLSTGLTMMGANYFAQQIVIGLVLILAVAVDQTRNRPKRRKA
jgi:ribose transport system permease protein